MPLTNFAPGEAQTNPDVLQAIILASEQFSIVASQDIVDIRGLKLWAKGRHVSAALQQRLLERKLLHPLEACLTAEDGVTPFTLLEQFTALMNQDNSLARALQPSAALLEEHLKKIPLHAVAQLLLTTAWATRPETLPHAVAGMALAGAIAHAQSTPVDMRLAMLGGLLHDIGETYIQPTYLDRSTPLDLLGYKHMMAHPRMAQMLLTATPHMAVPPSRSTPGFLTTGKMPFKRSDSRPICGLSSTSQISEDTATLLAMVDEKIVRKTPMPRSAVLTSSASAKARMKIAGVTSKVYCVVNQRLAQNCLSRAIST